MSSGALLSAPEPSPSTKISHIRKIRVPIHRGLPHPKTFIPQLPRLKFPNFEFVSERGSGAKRDFALDSSLKMVQKR
jgi:hypothetical protein